MLTAEYEAEPQIGINMSSGTSAFGPKPKKKKRRSRRCCRYYNSQA